MTTQEEKLRFFREIFKISNPYGHQLKVWERFENQIFPLILRAPTGSGKTEAVVAPFLYQFQTKDFSLAPRMIYVLPMRVLVNTITERIMKYALRVSPHITVCAHHGDYPYSPFFMYDIVVTTLDQFLYGFARASKQVGRHIDVPVGAIASSVVVFDEAHMYRDEFTFSIMRAVLEILQSSRIPFVLMTATMPETLERSLFEQIPIDDERRVVGEVQVNSSVELSIIEKPLFIDDEPNLEPQILEKIKTKKTLIVVNQVKRAQKLYKELTRRLENHPITLLHSRFTRLDRQRHETEALNTLTHKRDGKIHTPTQPSVVISTQVLEAGVDFSAELLLTELAPADSLVQRIGRCARYEGERGEVVVFPLEGERAHMPYEKSSVEGTLNWLRQNLESFNLRNFQSVQNFVSETLNYKANDIEATDTLIDIYECVLYADEEPKNITLRKDKSAKVVIVEPIQTQRRQTKEAQLENGIREIFRRGTLGDSSFEVDIKILWKWFRDGLISYELSWSGEAGGFKVVNLRERAREATDEDRRILPFRTYIIEKTHYDETLGVKGDEAEFI